MLGHLLGNKKTQEETKSSPKNFEGRYDLENIQIMAQANIRTHFIAGLSNPPNITGHRNTGHTTHTQ